MVKRKRLQSVRNDSDGYTSDYDNVPLAEWARNKKDEEEQKQARVLFDVDPWHCDTDDDFQSGYSSTDLEWSCTSESSDADDKEKKKNNSIREETLREIVMEYIASGTRCKTKTIRNKIFKEYKVNISTWQARNALHNCLVRTYGSYANSFSLVPELCRQIKEKNPDSIAEWSRHPETNEFEGLCIAYKACLDGFNDGCRPIIALDRSLLNSMYGGTILTATSVDANNGMYPVAIYICRRAAIISWNRFLHIIAPRLMKTKRPITFIHDFRNGIKLAVDHNFGAVSRFHRLCGRKLYQHINLGFREPTPQKEAFDAAKSYNREDHERALGNLSEHQRRWVEAGGESSWARHSYDRSASCPQMKNILSKEFNVWITDLKCLPICDLVMGFEAKLNQLFLRRQRNGRLQTDKHLVPRASTKLRDKIRNNIGFAARLDEYKPSTYIVINEDHRPTRNVDLAQRKCDCGEWHISGVPCVHAVAVLATKRPPRYERYVDEYYTIGRYKVSYDGIINRMASINEWRQVTGTNPPPLKEILYGS